jgi:Ran GTPase-activating protein (RanGAP) involved in mRNA processing and transport
MSMVNRTAFSVLKEASPEEERRATPGVAQLLNNTMQAYANVELSGVSIGQLEALADVLRTNADLKSINLSHNPRLDKTGLLMLANGLLANTSVTHINLSGCTAITDDAAAEFIRMLSKQTRYKDAETGMYKARLPSLLADLVLSSCPKIGNRLATAFAESLLPPAFDESTGDGFQLLQLRSLNLSGSLALSDVGVAQIAESMQSSTCLSSLCLQGCTLLSDKSVGAIADALTYSSCSLRELDFSWCELTDAAAASLSAGLADNHSLKSLKLACCVELSDNGATQLASALEHNATLTSLDLSWCIKLQEPALVAFYQALRDNHVLTSLDITGCPGKVVVPADVGGGQQSRPVSSRYSLPNAAASAALISGRFKRTTRPPPADGTASDARRSVAGVSPAVTPTLVRKGVIISGAQAEAVAWRASDGTFKSGKDIQTIAQALTSVLRRNRAYGRPPRDVPKVRREGGANEVEANNVMKRQLLKTSATTAAQMRRMVRGTIMRAAAMYNDEDKSGAFDLFVQTAESVNAATSFPAVQSALQFATNTHHENTATLVDKIWSLRSSFDTLLEALDDVEPLEEDEITMDQQEDVPGRKDSSSLTTVVEAPRPAAMSRGARRGNVALPQRGSGSQAVAAVSLSSIPSRCRGSGNCGGTALESTSISSSPPEKEKGLDDRLGAVREKDEPRLQSPTKLRAPRSRLQARSISAAPRLLEREHLSPGRGPLSLAQLQGGGVG